MSFEAAEDFGICLEKSMALLERGPEEFDYLKLSPMKWDVGWTDEGTLEGALHSVQRAKEGFDYGRMRRLRNKKLSLKEEEELAPSPAQVTHGEELVGLHFRTQKFPRAVPLGFVLVLFVAAQELVLMAAQAATRHDVQCSSRPVAELVNRL